MIKLFIGYDRYETVAYHVAAHSALTRCSLPISIVPLYKNSLKHILWRERDPLQSTDFAFSRFLVPYLSDFKGISIFMDCDVLIKCDLQELYDIYTEDPHRVIWCVKHDYVPKGETKFLGQTQTKYPMKNWSSIMIFNNHLCTNLTPDFVNASSGLDLHQFKWVDHINLIGSIPLTYNWLVGEYPHNDSAKILHYTQGTPCFDDYFSCDHAGEWWNEKIAMNSCVQHIDRRVKV